MSPEKFLLDMSFPEAVMRLSTVNTKLIEEEVKSPGQACPFVKWVGGKRSIIEDLLVNVPAEIATYWEPFVGGGALFFAINQRIKSAVISDVNIDLVIAYQVVKSQPDKLIARLKEHEAKHSEKYYYSVRSQYVLTDPIEVAARLIYLNKTCYNGLWRVNRKGEFNVPMGSYKNPTIVQEKNLAACHDALQKTVVKYLSYKDITPGQGDFVYFDPPYHPTTETSFTKYHKGDFCESDQNELAALYRSLAHSGIKVMLSNSNTPFIRKLYRGFNIRTVFAPRFVNCKPNKRNAVEEVLITNYKLP